MQKQEALDFLRSLAESEEGKKNITAVKDLSTSIYRIFPGKDTALEIDKIINPMKPASVSSGNWKVYSPNAPVEKKTVRPSVVAPPAADEELDPDEEDETLGGEPLDPEAFGVTTENYKDYLGLNTKEFFEKFQTKAEVETLASVLQINPKQGNAKLVSELQTAIKEYFERANEGDKN
jgi:hypothetical protein